MEVLDPVQSVYSTTEVQQSTTDANLLAQEDFLELMIAQLENQDPSNPVDNAEFLAQIAQFSIVDGISGLQTSVDALALAMQQGQVADAAALLGKDVLFDSSTASITSGGGIEGQVTLDSTHTDVQLEILDATGITVATESLGTLSAGSQAFAWDGTDANGNPVPPGEYSVRVTGTVGEFTQTLPVQLYGTVESVAVDQLSGDVSLQLDSGAILGLSDIYQYK